MFRLVQLLAALFFCLYTYLTAPMFQHSYIWLALSLLLLLVGVFRRPSETLLGSGIAMLGYGIFQLYSWYQQGAEASLGWNELVWLAIFPFAGLIGSIEKLTRSANMLTEKLTLYEQMQAVEDPSKIELNSVEQQLGFLGGPAFVYKLEEEVLRSLRERTRFFLVIAEIDHFQAYKELFGYEQSQFLLNQIAGSINDLENLPPTKGHLGLGSFAVIIPKRDEDEGLEQVSQFMDSLNDSFTELMLVRPRRESQVKIRMKYGVAACPADGIEARSLMDSAQSKLEGNGVIL
ncbi:hypothetical protein PA598K_05291 [Paenibacillus sp. 598K]|uniref:diguanylate cyclase domain-containing protein n=1 Tax=Paenibacillus sp. 598K TaxID=1117987 RepID=UPI000FFAAEDB|nr:diguanylate cyclase [Paenibacillus sp. 598K]GBF76799.1 hypothetical protein PA598K_05291 [Paenibacillus sp. 598K]